MKINDMTGLGSAFDFAKGVMDRIWPKQASEEEKLQAVSQIVPLIDNRDNAVINAQKAIIVAEMNQGDNYTKRARPTVVYGGLAFIFLVHVLFPIVAFFFKRPMPEGLALPGEFWAAWTAVCGIWAIGRSAEKRGVTNKLISMITGN